MEVITEGIKGSKEVTPTTGCVEYPFLLLNDGHRLPVLGLGTQPYGIASRTSAEEMEVLLEAALDLGYRNFDTSKQYRNEVEIGQALRAIFAKGKYSRSDVFITSKLLPFDIKKTVEEIVQNSLDQLQTTYVDLYLISWSCTPVLINEDDSISTNHKPIHVVWKQLEECVDKGMVRSIGVANFNCQMVLDLLAYARIRPAVNQIEVTPYLPQTDFIHFMHRCNIKVISISPLGRAGCFENSPEGSKIKLLLDETLNEVARKHNRSVVSIILRWLVQRNISMIPKTAKLDRLKENSLIFDFTLSEEDMATIASVENGMRAINPKHQQWFGYVPLFE